MTASRKTWNPPGWPWELECIAIATMLLSVFFPAIFDAMGIDRTPSLIDEATGVSVNGNPLAEQQQIVLSFGLVALYLIHLVIAATTFSHLTTPITHMITPLVFSGAAYVRASAYVEANRLEVAFFNGSTGNLILLILGVLVLCLVAARVRMARYLLLFRDEEWDLRTPTVFDSSFWSIISQWRPLIYMPRNYRACANGILVEGWFYIMPVPFEVFHTVTPIANVSMSVTGSYYATTARSLIRIELLDSTVPMFISPRHRDTFLQYCQKHIERRKASRGSTPRGTRAGTVAGATRPGTHHGTHHGDAAPSARA